MGIYSVLTMRSSFSQRSGRWALAWCTGGAVEPLPGGCGGRGGWERSFQISRPGERLHPQAMNERRQEGPQVGPSAEPRATSLPRQSPARGRTRGAHSSRRGKPDRPPKSPSPASLRSRPETGELRLGYAEFAGSVVMLGTCQMDSWPVRSEAWHRALAEGD